MNLSKGWLCGECQLSNSWLYGASRLNTRWLYGSLYSDGRHIDIRANGTLSRHGKCSSVKYSFVKNSLDFVVVPPTRTKWAELLSFSQFYTPV